MSGEQSYGRGVMLILLATLGWSLSGVFVRHVPGLTGWQINCWRGYSMGVALLVYLVIRYGDRIGERFREIPPGAFVAVAFFFSFGSTLYVTALTHAATANVAALTATAPIFTAMLSRMVTGESPSPATWTAAIVASAGVAWLVRDGMAAGNLWGNIAAIACALSFALQTSTLRRYRNFDLVPAVCVGGFVVFITAGLIGGGFNVPPREVAILLVMGPVQLAVPLIFFARGARSVPAIVMSLIVLLDVVLNPLWSWLGAGEQPTLNDAVGGAVIVTAVTISIAWGQHSAKVNQRARTRSGVV